MDGGNQRTEAEGIRILVRIKDSVRLLSVGIRLDRYSKMVVIGTVIAVAQRHINHLFMILNLESNKNPPNRKPLTAYRPLGPEGKSEEVPDVDPGAGRRCLPQTTRSAGASGLSLTENRCEKMQNLYRTDDDNHTENESGTDGDGNPGSDHANE